MTPPPYFAKIRQDAERLWQKLDDPVPAAPWHQLFRQVQSPDHVLSELLQNADDAGAKKASARIEDDYFIFEHDGADFTAEQFESLCRFGFSNKRNLHTIGFRGVGFKSTFSLGDRVEVVTPSLSVAFNKKRFTEPEWSNGAAPPRTTRIRVRLADRNRRQKLDQNLAKWIEGPAALLFFNSVEELTINGRTVRRQVLRSGPVPNSHWLRLTGAGHTNDLLLVRSKAEPFPADAIDEIRAERHVEDLYLPPCQIELVLGLTGAQRLFVVLPTGAELDVPFSANAPFIQDPARYAIKDPAMSATNRWLLARIGKLAGETVRGWLGNKSLSLGERATAYDLLCTETDSESELSNACTAIINDAVYKVLEGNPIALSTTGILSAPGNCLAVPKALHDVWKSTEVVRLFGTGEAHLLAVDVSSRAVAILASKDWVHSIDASDVIRRLEGDPNPPRPESWGQLHALWRFVQEEVKYDWNNEKRRDLRIVPVTGEQELFAANSVIRLSTRREAITEADWKFITDHALAIDSGWIQSLATRSAHGREPDDDGQSNSPLTLLQQLALHEPSAVDRIVTKAAEKLFQPGVPVASCIRIAHIVAALGAKVPPGFRYVSKDLHLRSANHDIVIDESAEIEDIAPESWIQQHILLAEYSANFTSCRRDVWESWTRTEASGLEMSPPLRKRESKLWSRGSVEKFVQDRGATKPAEYRYKRNDFTIVDFDFDRELLEHWASSAKETLEIWASILEMVLLAPEHAWKGKVEAEIRHNGTEYFNTLACGTIPSEWLLRFRSVPCLFDSTGQVHVPAELLIRTPDTEALIGIEPFVRADLDTERTKPLLRLLGVRDTPLGAEKILDRIRAHSTMPQPERFLTEIARLYQALDRVVSRSTPAHLQKISEVFSRDDLILTDSLEWVSSGEAAIFPEGDSPSPAIHHEFRQLSFWPRIGVAERPAIEQTLEWLQSLEPGTKLEGASLRRVRTVLAREPRRVLEACNHWLSLDSTWQPIKQLRYRLTMQSLMKWGELAPFIKQSTANLQMVSADVTLLPGFSDMRDLTQVVELRVTKRVDDHSRAALVPDWLKEFAVNLCRIELPDESDTIRVRSVAERLYFTDWQPVSKIEVTPYIDGAPAGEPSRPKVFWGQADFFVGALSPARLHKDLVEELSRPFSHAAISAATAACADRSAAFVREYMAAEFKINPDLPLPGSAPASEQGNAAPDSPPAIPESIEPPRVEPLDTNENTPEQLEDEEQGELPPATSVSRKPVVPEQSLIWRYASTQGFRAQKDGKRFLNPDGRYIQRGEKPFSWEERRPDGDLIARIAVYDSHLSEGFQIPAELWLLVKDSPAATRLVLLGDRDQPIALPGVELVRLHGAGKIKLYPSQYRLIESA